MPSKEIWTPDTIADFWEHNEAPFAGDVSAPELIRLTRKHIKGKILDIGAGSGALLRLLPSFAIGVDIAPQTERIQQGSIAALPFSDESFDTVFAVDVLEHLTQETRNTGWNEVKRVLRPKGKFIFVVPNNEDLGYNRVRCPNCHTDFHRWGHLKRFNSEIIRLQLTDHFRIIEMKALPISLMAEHRIIHYFWKIFLRVGFCQPSDLLVIVEK